MKFFISCRSALYLQGHKVVRQDGRNDDGLLIAEKLASVHRSNPCNWRPRLLESREMDEIPVIVAVAPYDSPARVRPSTRAPFRIAAVQHRWHPDPIEHEAALGA